MNLQPEPCLRTRDRDKENHNHHATHTHMQTLSQRLVVPALTLHRNLSESARYINFVPPAAGPHFPSLASLLLLACIVCTQECHSVRAPVPQTGSVLAAATFRTE